ncbi:tyrosinase [Colletotrichum plurivorum]|uniref:tyrosinase n=1 Tax=Colletotrichum plurivorum TaxID=2175906 RepID=A0A8H6K3D9_9PEZI|nr:tyrosinase [Colletotrichum plurivorum]
MMAYLSAGLLACLLAYTLTLSLPDLQEMRKPLPVHSQQAPAIKNTFEHLRKLEDLGPAGDEIWNSEVLPREGGFLWVQANSTENREGWGITMFHALHCLQMVREVFKMAVVPSDHDESHHSQLSHRRSASHSHHVDPKHATHCFSYLYQRKFDAQGRETSWVVNGAGVQHMCRDPQLLWDVVGKSEQNALEKPAWEQGYTVWDPAFAWLPTGTLGWGEDSNPPVRRDINDLVREGGPQLSLFILALEGVQSRPEGAEDSYFQIADPKESGYCVHYGITFPTWHRIYLLHFESVISQAALEIATRYAESDRNEYMRAAKSLRLPYWDWLSNAELPDVVTRENITVNTPEGRKEMANPLFAYRFHAVDRKNGPAPNNEEVKVPQTLRRPGTDGNSNHTAANNFLSQRQPLCVMTENRLRMSRLYNEFARMPSPFDPFDSNIEVLHNAIHNAAGGEGSQLTTTKFAAFDPLFWLHHANLDRVFAFWQVLNPTSMMVEEKERSGELAGLDTGLKPFLRQDRELWTSRQAWDWKALGYTYAGPFGENNQTTERQTMARKMLEQRYWSKFSDEHVVQI